MNIQSARTVVKFHKNAYSQEQKSRLSRGHMTAKGDAQPPRRLFVDIKEVSGSGRND